MSVKYTLIVVASASVLAFPAAAQVVGVDAGAKVETPVAGAQAEVEAQAGAESAGEASATNENQARAGAGAGPVVAATAADVRAGARVLDPQGGEVGTIESVDAEGAVVSTGNVRAKMPISSFGKTDGGLVISMNRAELEAAVSARGGPSE